jgi:manganese transport system ATP-binding protein
MPSAVEARGLVVAYGDRVALGPSDVDVPAGAVTTMLGPNGSGKSTLLHAIAGLVEPAGGTLRVLGTTPEAARPRVAYVFQSAMVNEALPVTVREVVTMGRYARLGAFGRLGRIDRAAVTTAMERVDVVELAGRHLRELSGGQRQAVFVAQGLAQEADLLLLDEPITGLDIPAHERIDLVIEEERARGTTVLLTTHDLAEAARGDHVLLLGGRVVAQGPPGDVLSAARLAEAYGAALLHGGTLADDPHHHHHGDPS